MVGVQQYPDTATLPGKAGTGIKGTNGIIQVSNSEPEFSVKGRYEPSTDNRVVFNVDGVVQKAKGIFYVPNTVKDIPTGVNITITNSSGKKVVTTKVLFFSKGQMNGRIYL